MAASDLGRHRRAHGWSMEDVAPFDGVSLLAHVERLLPAGGRGPLVDGGEPLPDVGLLDKSQSRWMGRTLGGVMSVRGGRSRGPEPLQATAAVLEVVRHRATTKSVHVAGERLAGLTGPSDADRLIEAVFADRRFDRGRLAEFSRWLCRYGTRRWHVKAGIALLGACGNSTDATLITRLGLLEELTLYSLVALQKLGEPPEEAIFELGQQVTGWGRIHAIHRLKSTSNPVIQSWLLRGGYRNDVMVEEIAWIAATSGHLADALEGPIDEELLDGAGELLAALATGGPAEDMSDYADADRALTAYLDGVSVTELTLARLRYLRTLEVYLTDSRENPFIDSAARARLAARATQGLDRDGSFAIIEDALVSERIADVRLAISLSPRFAIDPRPAARRALARHPHDGYLWQTLFAGADQTEVSDLVDLARRLLPFDAVQTGAADDLGLGPEYGTSHSLDVILHALRGFPGQGWDAIRLGLDSRVTRTRNSALHALQAWPRDQWPPDAPDLVARLAWRDPNDGVRKRARAVLGTI